MAWSIAAIQENKFVLIKATSPLIYYIFHAPKKYAGNKTLIDEKTGAEFKFVYEIAGTKSIEYQEEPMVALKVMFSQKNGEPVSQVTFNGITYSLKSNIHFKTATDLMHWLDTIREDWGRWHFGEDQALSLIEKYKIQGSKIKVGIDYQHKKINLKDKYVSIINTNQLVKNRKGEEYFLCRFEEDIKGSCLDGESTKKDHLFLPKNALVWEEITNVAKN